MCPSLGSNRCNRLQLKELELKKGLNAINDNVFIISPDVGPDVQAVIGAKNSRAPDLKARWEELVNKTDIPLEDWDWSNPPQPVKDFLDMNLAGYAHASIGEMAPVFVSNQGFGWPASWLALDFPGYVGQEASSRVVEQNAVPDAREICRFAPESLQDLHEAWLGFYDSLDQQVDGEAASKAYRFDNKRFALPGTMRTGTGYYGSKARDTVRHLQIMESFGGFAAELAGEFLEGCAAYAPQTVKSLTMKNGQKRSPRTNHYGHWRTLSLTALHDLTPDSHPKDGVHFYPADFTDRHANLVQNRDAPRTYMDDLYHQCGQVRVVQYVSVGTSRDEHRHRMAMPWTVQVVVDNDDRLVLCPWTPFDVPEELWDLTNRRFFELWDNAETPVEKWQALHALPFCAMLRMESYTTLPYMLYKAELRSGAPNGHWEYKKQNMELLRQMCAYLPKSVVDRELISGVLDQETDNLI